MSKIRFLVLSLALLTSGLVRDIDAAEGGWLKVPNQWLLHRFVRPSTAPSRTYKVALAFPPGAKAPKVAQSSGNSDVDKIAGDYALDLVRNTGSLKDLGKAKELYFQLILTPPALDVKMRSVEGRRPIPPDKELYTPTAETVYVNANQNETSGTGEVVVVFPPSGGYASESMITVSTGNRAVDRYELHASALNWQTSRKSSQPQVLRLPFGRVHPQRWQSINDR